MTRIRNVTAAAGLLAAAAAPCGADVRFRALVTTGDPVPGVAGAVFSAGPPNPSGSCTINSQGRFAAMAYSSAGTALVAGSARGPMELRVVVREGVQWPGLSTGVGVSVFGRRFALARDGRVCGGALLAGPGVSSANAYIFYAETAIGAPPIMLARQGGAVPGLAGVTFGNINALETSPWAGGDGAFAFSAPLAGSGISAINDSAVWRGSLDNPGPMSILAREGEQVPGQPAGVVYGELSFASPLVGGNGETVMVAPLTATTSTNTLLVFPASSNVPVLMTSEGGTLRGFSVTSFVPQQLQVGDSFLIGFNMNIDRAIANGRAAFVTPWDNLGMLRAVGEAGANAPPFPTLSFVGPQAIALGGDGKLGWITTLRGPGVTTANDLACYAQRDLADPGTSLVAREGDASGLLPAGQVFAGFGGTLGRDARGRMAVQASISGTGVTAANNAGILVADELGAAQVAIRLGTPVPLGPSDARAPQVLTANTWQQMPVMTPRGEFIMTASFAGGSRAVVLGEIDPCLADFDRDGLAGLQDLLDYLAAWFALAPGADLDRAGGVTLQDLFDYLALWFGGCA